MRMLRTTLMFALLACPALAVDQIVVVKPGGEGNARRARSFLDDWVAYLKSSAGLDLQGEYFNDVEKAVAHLKSNRPAYGVIGIDFFLEYGDDFGMQPVLSSLPGGKPTERFMILARPDGPQSVEDLAGKRLAGKHIALPRFASELILGGRVPGKFTIVQESTLGSIKKVEAGEADAVVVLEAEWAGIQKNPRYGANLRPIHTSDPIPTALAVVFGDTSPEPFVKALTSMKDDATGAELLDTMGNAGFAPVDGEALEAMRRAYDAGQEGGN